MSRIQIRHTKGKEEFTGTVSKYGSCTRTNDRGVDKKKMTICLQELKNSNGKQVADHMWIHEGEKFWKQGIRIGDYISFKAVKYKYNYRYGKAYNYALKKCENIRLIKRNDKEYSDIASMLISLAHNLCHSLQHNENKQQDKGE